MSATVESPNPAAENPLGPNAVLLLPRSTHEPIRALTNFAELVQHAINTAAKPAEVRPAYAAALAAETGQQPMPPEKLVAPMLARFMDTDRGFRRHRAQGR